MTGTENLHEYLAANAVRCPSEQGEADVVFFGVRKGPHATAQGLRQAIAGHKGEFGEVDPLDGKEHSYIELGGWVGDQGEALTLIGLGAALGLWSLMTPKTMMGDLPDELVQKMASAGFVSLMARKA